MSVHVMNQVFRRYPVGGGEMLLALAFADRCDDEGRMMVVDNVPELARRTRQTERGVQKQIARMVECGWLLPVHRSDGGLGKCSVYRINPAWIEGAPMEALNPERGSGFEGSNGERGSGFGGGQTPNQTTSNPEPCSPSYKEPNTPNTKYTPNPLVKAKGAARPVGHQAPVGLVVAVPSGPGHEAEQGAVGLMGFKAFIAACRSAGEKPVPADDPVWDYAGRVGIGSAILALHWAEFKRRRLETGKRQRGVKGWRQTFRTSVRDNWYGLWFIPPGGGLAELTTKGRQAERDQAAEAAEREESKAAA